MHNFRGALSSVFKGSILPFFPFDRFTCTIDYFPGVEFQLEPVGIFQKSNLNQLHTMILRIQGYPSEQNRPVPGMSTTVTVHYKPDDTTLTSVPVAALVGDNDTTAVWIYNDSTQRVHRRQIFPLEVRGNGEVVVEKGLQAGETIITARVNSLKEGEQVEPIEAPSATNVGGLL